jgi:hypothetical protein
MLVFKGKIKWFMVGVNKLGEWRWGKEEGGRKEACIRGEVSGATR